MPRARAHPEVDAYVDRLPPWRRAICQELRELIWSADPDIEETIKRSRQPYFVLEGNVCALLAAKAHVNLALSINSTAPLTRPRVSDLWSAEN